MLPLQNDTRKKSVNNPLASNTQEVFSPCSTSILVVSSASGLWLGKENTDRIVFYPDCHFTMSTCRVSGTVGLVSETEGNLDFSIHDSDNNPDCPEPLTYSCHFILSQGGGLLGLDCPNGGPYGLYHKSN